MYNSTGVIIIKNRISVVLDTVRGTSVHMKKFQGPKLLDARLEGLGGKPSQIDAVNELQVEM